MESIQKIITSIQFEKNEAIDILLSQNKKTLNHCIKTLETTLFLQKSSNDISYSAIKNSILEKRTEADRLDKLATTIDTTIKILNTGDLKEKNNSEIVQMEKNASDMRKNASILYEEIDKLQQYYLKKSAELTKHTNELEKTIAGLKEEVENFEKLTSIIKQKIKDETIKNSVSSVQDDKKVISMGLFSSEHAQATNAVQISANTEIQSSQAMERQIEVHEKKLDCIIDSLSQLQKSLSGTNHAQESIALTLGRIMMQGIEQGETVVKALVRIGNDVETGQNDIEKQLINLLDENKKIKEHSEEGSKLIKKLVQWKVQAEEFEKLHSQGFSELSQKEVFVRAIKLQISSKIKEYTNIVTGVIQQNAPSLFPDQTTEAVWKQIDTNLDAWDKISGALPFGVGIALIAVKEIASALWMDYKMGQAQNATEVVMKLGESHLLKCAEEVAKEFNYLFLDKPTEKAIYPKLQLCELGSYIGERIISFLSKNKAELEDTNKPLEEQMCDYIHTHRADEVRTPATIANIELPKTSMRTKLKEKFIHPGKTQSEDTSFVPALKNVFGSHSNQFTQEGIVHHRAVVVVPPGMALSLDNASHILVSEDRKKDINAQCLKYGYRFAHLAITVETNTQGVITPSWYRGLYAYPMTDQIKKLITAESELVTSSYITVAPVTPPTPIILTPSTP